MSLIVDWPNSWWLRPLESLLGQPSRKAFIVSAARPATWERLLELSDPHTLPSPNHSPQNLDYCQAALGLRSGHLHEAHEFVQNSEEPDGMAWHSIMHRLEGDLWNAKYWARRVGRHPVQAALVAALGPERLTTITSLSKLIGPDQRWQSEVWIDLWGKRDSLPAADRAAIEAIAIREWELLFERCA